MLFYIEIFREHKQVKRPGMSEEDGDTGADEVVSFIDLPNNLTKLPEKGILKKHGGYGIVMVDEPIRISGAITHS